MTKRIRKSVPRVKRKDTLIELSPGLYMFSPYWEKAKGYDVRKSVVKNQQLHPEYITDVDDGDTGFGNTSYRSFWPTLYCIDKAW